MNNNQRGYNPYHQGHQGQWTNQGYPQQYANKQQNNYNNQYEGNYNDNNNRNHQYNEANVRNKNNNNYNNYNYQQYQEDGYDNYYEQSDRNYHQNFQSNHNYDFQPNQGFNQQNHSNFNPSHYGYQHQNFDNNEANLQNGIGKKKKKKKNKPLGQSMSMQLPQPPKQKQKSLKEEISNEYFFQQKTQIIQPFICPFNSQHQIMQEKRFLTHIQNCKKKSPEAQFFEGCPYDPCHYFLKKQIQDHKLVCPKRLNFVQFQGWSLPQRANASQVRNVFQQQIFQHNIHDATIDTNKTESQYESKKIEHEQYLIGQIQSFIL